MSFLQHLKQIPIGKLLLKVTDLDETAQAEVADATSVAVATAIAQLQQLKGRRIKFNVEITVDEVLE